MKDIFKFGDTKEYEIIVTSADIAAFESGVVHEVYSTFALVRDAEWSGRLFVLDMKDDDEEGIGVHIEVDHIGPAFVGNKVRFQASFEGVDEKGVIKTGFKAYVKDRLISKGIQGQKIIKKEKIGRLFNELSN